MLADLVHALFMQHLIQAGGLAITAGLIWYVRARH